MIRFAMGILHSSSLQSIHAHIHGDTYISMIPKKPFGPSCICVQDASVHSSKQIIPHELNKNMISGNMHSNYSSYSNVKEFPYNQNDLTSTSWTEE